jgi:hypothetical protein
MENPSPPPQWAPDPMGRYAQRFWDGNAWTDHVATAAGGEPTTDPLVAQNPVAAQWAPDPTGRYAQRYWDGDAWTDYVATAAGGTPANDPLDRGVAWPAPVAAPSAATTVATADPEPQPEWIDTRAPGRRGLRLATWLALGLAVVVGVTFALTRGSGDGELPTASSTHDGAAGAPATTTGPAGASTTTRPGSPPSTTRVAGSGGTGRKTAPTTTRPGTPQTTSKPAAAAAPHSVNSAEDQAVADQVALTAADLPHGFRADSPAPSHALDSPFPQCKAFHTRLAGTNAVATAMSPDFSDAAQRVASSVHLLVTQSQAASVVDMLANRALPRCLDQVFEKEVRASIARSSAAPIDALDVRVRRLSVAPVGDQSAALRVVTTVTSRGVTTPISADLVSFRVGRAAVLSVFVSPQSDGARDVVLASISERLRQAGAAAQ